MSRALRRAVAPVLAAVALAVAATVPRDVATALERVRDQSTLDITTVGRKSGRRHTKPIWFVVDDGRIVVQAGKSGKTDWYRNLRKDPSVVVRTGGYTFQTTAVPVTDPKRVEAIHRLFLQKYTSAWLLSFFGSSIGRGLPVELVPESVTPPSGE
ncbi:MAG TPA: nitroreductase/quinone reductase family protein [Candidatus Binatia bacterium]|nr:nitroreductase/quinone reductase family protein [Candidatus Binatia bacterium]